MNTKSTTFPIYGRASLLKQVASFDDLQTQRNGNYLLMIENFHKTNPQAHINKVLKQTVQFVPQLATDKEMNKNTSWSLTVPHWIVEIFTRDKVANEILRH